MLGLQQTPHGSSVSLSFRPGPNLCWPKRLASASLSGLPGKTPGLLDRPLNRHLPHLEAGTHTKVIPPYLKALCSLLLEVFQLPDVSLTALGEVTAAGIYAKFMSTPPQKN